MGSELSLPNAGLKNSNGMLVMQQKLGEPPKSAWPPPRTSANRSASVAEGSSPGPRELSLTQATITRSISMTAPHEGFANQGACQLSSSARPGAMGLRKTRRSSMQAAIDYTKIDTALYHGPSPDQTPTIEEEADAQPENAAGSVLMTLAYQVDTSLLSVKIHSASDLIPFEDGGVRNPYFVLTVLPDNNVSRQSKVQTRTSDPSYEEEFIFEISGSLDNKSLLVSLHDFDQFTKSECKGTCIVRLSELIGHETERCFHSWIAKCSTSRSQDPAYCGDLMFSMEYQETTERLTVVVAKARCLKADYDNVTLGTYVKISVWCVGKKLKKKRTAHAKSKRNPEWNEAVVLPLTRYQVMHVTLHLEVVKDKLAGAEKLGRIVIGPNSSGEEKEHWADMLSGKSPLEWWHALRPLRDDTEP